MSNRKRALLIPDCHFPYADERAYALMLKVAKDVNPQEIVLMGDFLDCYPLSKYDKDPNGMHNFKSELNVANKKLEEIRCTFPRAKKYFLVGNHEFRVNKYLQRQAPEISDVVGVETLLNLKGLEIVDYTPGQYVSILNNKLICRHEPMGSLQDTINHCGKSVVVAHHHCQSEYHSYKIDGTLHSGYALGWLGDKKSKAFNYVKKHHQWSLGFGVATLEDDDIFVANIHIQNYKCDFNGKTYVG